MPGRSRLRPRAEVPELPEVETIRRQMEPLVSGRRVIDADAHSSDKFSSAVEVIGARFSGVGRRGKYLLLATDDDRELVAHLGMTGSFSFVAGPSDDDGPHVRARWRLEARAALPEQTMVFSNVRRFGRLRVVPAGDYQTIPTLAAAGPEPFDPDFDGRAFWRLLSASRRRLKTKLLSQRPIAGVGNIYADEALWLARINPNLTRLGQARATELLTALRQVMGQAIDHGGTTLRDYRTVDGRTGDNQTRLAAYGRAGLDCLRCESTLRSAVIDGRTTTWCPNCQRR